MLARQWRDWQEPAAAHKLVTSHLTIGSRLTYRIDPDQSIPGIAHRRAPMPSVPSSAMLDLPCALQAAKPDPSQWTRGFRECAVCGPVFSIALRGKLISK